MGAVTRGDEPGAHGWTLRQFDEAIGDRRTRAGRELNAFVVLALFDARAAQRGHDVLMAIGGAGRNGGFPKRAPYIEG
jgi:hypothetical protein